MISLLQPVDAVDYINDCEMSNHPHVPGISSTWSWCRILLINVSVQFATMLLRNCASMFMREIDLWSPSPVMSLSGFDIRVTLASWNE